VADGSLRALLRCGLGSLEEAVDPELQSLAGVLLHVPQVWFSLSPDSPNSIFCFLLLQDRAVRDLVFDTVFHQCDHTKLELALAFLGFSPVVARQGPSPPLLWPHVAEKGLPSLAAQCWDHAMGRLLQHTAPPCTSHHPRTTPLQPVSSSTSSQHSVSQNVYAGRVKWLLPPLEQSCSGAGLCRCHFSLCFVWLHGLCCKWMGFELCR